MEAIEFNDTPKSEINGFRSPEIRLDPKSQPLGYTSLKDILQSPSTSPPGRTMTAYSPTASSSWQEIPIRNPLVKHAAMAYLQPMSSQTASFGTRMGFLAGVRAKCGCDGDLGCVSWLYDVVLRAARDLFGYGHPSNDDNNGGDDIDGDNEKVD